MLEKLLSVIYPHKCSFCGALLEYDNDKFICGRCLSSLPYLEKGGCAKCGQPLGEFALPVCASCRKFHHTFSHSFTPLAYTGSVRRAILGIKFHNAHYITRSLAFLIADRILSEDMPLFDFITYVPLSRERYAVRRFDQSRLIASFLSDIMHIPVIDALEHLDGGARQSSLPLNKRRENAKASFRAKSISLSGTALLVDDIYTTGATMDACTRLLLKMGCETVYIAAAAMTPLR